MPLINSVPYGRGTVTKTATIFKYVPPDIRMIVELNSTGYK